MSSAMYVPANWFRTPPVDVYRCTFLYLFIQDGFTALFVEAEFQHFSKVRALNERGAQLAVNVCRGTLGLPVTTLKCRDVLAEL